MGYAKAAGEPMACVPTNVGLCTDDLSGVAPAMIVRHRPRSIGKGMSGRGSRRPSARPPALA